MPYNATIFAEQIKVIDKKRLLNYIDTLPNKYIEKVNNALRISVGLFEISKN